MAGKHGWNDLEDYLRVLLRVVDDHPFVIAHTLTIKPSPEGGLVRGQVYCHGDIVIDVHKRYEVRRRSSKEQARTVRYSYNARYEKGRRLLRYDNSHARPVDPTPHHKHDFGRRKVTHVGPDWPYLSDVLDEVMAIVWR